MQEDRTPDAAARTVVALAADLIFASKIRGAAKAVGVGVVTARTADEVVERARAGADLILIDLDARRASPVEAIERLKADRDTDRIRVVAFVSHVNRDAIRAANAAGADQVLARSAFVQRLPGLLRGTDVAASGEGNGDANP